MPSTWSLNASSLSGRQRAPSRRSWPSKKNDKYQRRAASITESVIRVCVQYNLSIFVQDTTTQPYFIYKYALCILLKTIKFTYFSYERKLQFQFSVYTYIHIYTYADIRARVYTFWLYIPLATYTTTGIHVKEYARHVKCT